ncbi:PREDICTED: cytochrome c oxidase subunit 4 isoform 1, mitochondrial-like isoform X2 [Priapulus caudatus]|nr:PREDICTED: cytochrome c oxidase subunit 4 isoform 1, mitochondrial-like isoform X2 [Priapulus caudatus]XP_014680813.1 PREDICTED: cytochrome c oxidase subunit 4 isoform 1, mitochondrial-like isoform X2 [Priapulus caudatus]
MAGTVLRASTRQLLVQRSHLLAPVTGYHARAKVGNRDIVGFGLNGEPTYVDRGDFPCPAVRFMENTADVYSMREKEKTSWIGLSMDDKKALYRASFCQTFAEMHAQGTGEWKSLTAGTIFGITLALWIVILVKLYVYEKPPHTLSDEWKAASLKRIIDQQQGRIEGLSSNWDYEKKEWK